MLALRLVQVSILRRRRAAAFPRGRPRCRAASATDTPADHGRFRFDAWLRSPPAVCGHASTGREVRPMLLMAAAGGGIRAGLTWTVRGLQAIGRHHLVCGEALHPCSSAGASRRIGRADGGPVQRYADASRMQPARSTRSRKKRRGPPEQGESCPGQLTATSSSATSCNGASGVPVAALWRAGSGSAGGRNRARMIRGRAGPTPRAPQAWDLG
jgi:hypothetical protein